MKKLLAFVALCLLMATSSAAQNPRLTSKMLYHNGPLLTGVQNVYVVWYGCWTNNCGNLGDIQTMQVLEEFLINLGNTPYAQINSTYTDASGQPAASSFIFGGSALNSSYSEGADLGPSNFANILSYEINNFWLPQDSQGIYVIVSSADIASSATGFCSSSAPPHHGTTIVNGSPVKYIFLGNPKRCPSVAGPQLSPTGPTPNNSYPGDALVANLAHALNGLVTNPAGNGWFDRYGLENGDKCQDALGHPAFGQTYLTANGARGNIKMGDRDYLLPQNWVNDRKARCALSR